MVRMFDPDWRLRVATIALLVIAIVRPPLPVPDYHQVEHRDGPGQFCEYHEHLLRWHSDGGSETPTAVLHWHWMIFRPLQSTPSPSDDPDSPLNICHSLGTDWLAPNWAEAPKLSTSRTTIPAPRLSLKFWTVASPQPFGLHHLIDPSPPSSSRAHDSRVLSISAPRCSLLQLWTC